MGNTLRVGIRLRERLKAERERRGWTQLDVAQGLQKWGVYIYDTTIAKIEAGDRSVQTDELDAFANMFNISVDALLGRNAANTDLVWATSKLTSNAQKVVNEVNNLYTRIDGDLQDVKYYSAHSPENVRKVCDAAQDALNGLQKAATQLTTLAGLFPFSISKPH